MLYTTTEKHEELRERIRDFAESEVAPIAQSLDLESRFPKEEIMKLAKMGIMGIPYEKKFGGMGLDTLSYAIAVEELSRVDGGTGVILSAHTSLGSYPIEAFGTEEQKKKYLTPLAKGEKIGAFGLTEENAGSDASGTETTAVLDGNHYVLNGSKIFITNAPEADIYIVFAMTDPSKGNHGISAFIVEKDWDGFTFGEPYNKMGIRSSATAELRFNKVKVPKENLLGQEGQGFRIAMQTLDGGRIGIAAQALGIAQGAYEAALEYSRERIQFGASIAANQGISFKLADMATELRAARFLVYSAAEMKDAGERFSMEAAMAKQYASEMALRVTNEALQIHGGNGYLKGMDVERAYRDAKITTIYEGTNEIQRVVIAAHILGKIQKPEVSLPGVARLPETGYRKGIMLEEGSVEEKVDQLVASLKEDGYDFTVGIGIDEPINTAERVVSIGMGASSEKAVNLVKDLAKNAGAALGSSRPVAEDLKIVPLERYVGLSGQKFQGNLYIACGVSGAAQHLKGIKNASTIVAINNNPNAKIFKNADYGIVGDVEKILPVLIKALDTGEKKQAPPMVKIKRPTPRKVEPTWDYYVCNGCGYEYDPGKGDPEAEVRPGTLFTELPEDWTCPSCGEEKDVFIKA